MIHSVSSKFLLLMVQLKSSQLEWNKSQSKQTYSDDTSQNVHLSSMVWNMILPRKSTKTQTFLVEGPDGTSISKGYLPVPYNMKIELSVMTKLNEDDLQITEQILPYFQPSYSLPIKIGGNVDTTVNVPIVLNNIEMLDEYEGNFDTRRTLVYTFRFTAKTYIYGPTRDVSDNIVKTRVGYVAGSGAIKADGTLASTSYQRDVTYSVTPRAVKDYDGVVKYLVGRERRSLIYSV